MKKNLNQSVTLATHSNSLNSSKDLKKMYSVAVTKMVIIITFFLLQSCSSTRGPLPKHQESWDHYQHSQMIDGQASRVR